MLIVAAWCGGGVHCACNLVDSGGGCGGRGSGEEDVGCEVWFQVQVGRSPVVLLGMLRTLFDRLLLVLWRVDAASW